jgi:hypothetical protein
MHETSPLPVGREALALPLALLTVAAVGGGHVLPDGTIRFTPPPLMALVLAALLLALLARAGAIAAGRLFSPTRGALENATGAVVLVALLAATAQVFHLLTPARGLMNVCVNVLFLALLSNTFARQTDRRHLLWSLAIVFGAALVLKFVVLDALAAPADSLAGRLFSAAIEGLSLGALGAEPASPVMGYVAFAVVSVYLVALWWLPHATPHDG